MLTVYVCGQRAFGRAVLELCLEEGHRVAGVSAPLFASSGDRPDRLRYTAQERGIPVMPPGMLSADTLPAGVDLILAAHSHDFIGRKTRHRARLGAIGYHPSLLPLHRGRDAVRWALRDGDKITGGSIYWLSDTVDAGDLAAQDWVWIEPHDTVDSLWREKLFPLGVMLFRRALRDVDGGRLIRVPQAEHLATWEPSWDRPPLRRPDLLMIGHAPPGVSVVRDADALHR